MDRAARVLLVVAWATIIAVVAFLGWRIQVLSVQEHDNACAATNERGVLLEYLGDLATDTEVKAAINGEIERLSATLETRCSDWVAVNYR